jgi:hypothetical protein
MEGTQARSPGILHLSYPPFTPISSWMHDTWQTNIQGLRIKIKNLLNKEKYDSVFFSSLRRRSFVFFSSLPPSTSSYHRRRPPSSITSQNNILSPFCP